MKKHKELDIPDKYQEDSSEDRPKELTYTRYIEKSAYDQLKQDYKTLQGELVEVYQERQQTVRELKSEIITLQNNTEPSEWSKKVKDLLERFVKLKLSYLDKTRVLELLLEYEYEHQN